MVETVITPTEIEALLQSAGLCEDKNADLPVTADEENRRRDGSHLDSRLVSARSRGNRRECARYAWRDSAGEGGLDPRSKPYGPRHTHRCDT